MLIRDGENFVEILVTDRTPPESPCPGDLRLSVTVSSNGFGGRGSAWIAAPVLATFVEQMRLLEQQRQGTAKLESMSPGEFHLRFWSIDRRGHVAVGGRLTGPNLHLLEFAFEFDPSLLPGVLAGFEALVAD